MIAWNLPPSNPLSNLVVTHKEHFMHKSVIFREYDIRGVFNQDYDLDFAYNLGKAYVSFALKRNPGKKVKLSVGYDARLSSPSISKSLIKGLIESGADVLNIGLVTSPISYFSTFTIEELTGAIMITGSHNPPEYNGFKISFGKTTIFGSAIQELKSIIDSNEYVSPTSLGKETTFDIFSSYIERYKKEFPDLSNVKVVLDCGNGAAGVIARRLYESVGIKPTILCEEPDGRFPVHHPDPTIETNMEMLKKKVLELGADVGIGFDGDADRIGIIDNEGRFILGDELMVLLARDVLKSHPGAKIVGDVKCSDRLYRDIEDNGGIPIMWKTGHSLIKEKIKLEKAPFGGEMSGHIFFNDRNYGYDDALYAGLRVCEIISKSGKSISQLLCDLPKAFNTPEIRIDTTEEKKVAIVEALKTHFGAGTQDIKVNLLDGIRLSFPDGWALARSSNTQPVLVLRFESWSPEGLARIENQVRSIVNPML
jgi:phosphomannomutase/phosphomannomutase/phosphoglucomutase